MAKKINKKEEKKEPVAASLILVSPKMSEKSMALATPADKVAPVYTFSVPENTSKPLIRAEFKRLYKIVPRRVNITRQGKIKKASIFLAMGQKIDFV